MDGNIVNTKHAPYNGNWNDAKLKIIADNKRKGVGAKDHERIYI